jgi:hypothetical protein
VVIGQIDVVDAERVELGDVVTSNLVSSYQKLDLLRETRLETENHIK